jgi:hypothetical protein
LSDDKAVPEREINTTVINASRPMFRKQIFTPLLIVASFALVDYKTVALSFPNLHD